MNSEEIEAAKRDRSVIEMKITFYVKDMDVETARSKAEQLIEAIQHGDREKAEELRLLVYPSSWEILQDRETAAPRG